jgi:hypothetical protein
MKFLKLITFGVIFSLFAITSSVNASSNWQSWRQKFSNLAKIRLSVASSFEASGAEVLASCLTLKGYTLYGTSWCPHCQNQEKILGAGFKQINYIECDGNTWEQTVCAEADIGPIPAWQDRRGKETVGVQELKDLAELSGCSYQNNQRISRN